MRKKLLTIQEARAYQRDSVVGRRIDRSSSVAVELGSIGPGVVDLDSWEVVENTSDEDRKKLRLDGVTGVKFWCDDAEEEDA